MKQSFFIASLFICGVLLTAACSGKSDSESSTSNSEKTPAKTETASTGKKTDDTKKAAGTNRKGRLVYKQYCVICHGADGKLGVSDAKDLSVSTIDMEERINQITNGKGLMTPYKDILSEEQIQSVAEYLDELLQ